jgi:predicted O-methyltransferase YrrM/tetratricopeptide (TPR) repeat protein
MNEKNYLIEYILDPENPETNFNLATEYFSIGQTAAAISFFLRCADRSGDDLDLAYECLLHIGTCFDLQGNRFEHVRCMYKHAMSILPKRPEAYYKLANFQNWHNQYQDAYYLCKQSLENCDFDSPKLRLECGYPGKWGILYEKVVSSWWWGKTEEHKEGLLDLRNMYFNDLDDYHKNFVQTKIKNLNIEVEEKNMDKLEIGRKKIIDCFRFFNEKELLELRYKLLHDKVDKFIVLEGTKTHSGNDWKPLAKEYIKELNLPEEKFIFVQTNLPSNDEDVENTEFDIIFRSLSGKSNDTYKNSLNARTRERLVLDDLLSVISQFDDRDIFFVSDADEIINPKYINYFTYNISKNQNKIIKIPLVELEGRANFRAYHSDTNIPLSTDNVFFVCTKKHFEKATPAQMRFNIQNPFETVYVTEDGKRLKDCGWHFSWMGDSSRLKTKQKSTSHYADHIESAIIKDMNSKELEDYIDKWTPKDNGLNTWGNKKVVLRNYDLNNLPSEILEFEHLKKFFIPETLNIEPHDPFIKESTRRTDIINFLIEKTKSKKYLEIGVSKGDNISNIICDYKVGVDPNEDSPATFHLTSDEFFKQNKEKFDIIFIDGLHEYNQVLTDILNSLDILNVGGYIICHDMNPTKEEYQRPYPVVDTWNGDSWKAFVHLRKERNDLEMFVVDTDHGCGVIRKGIQNLVEKKEDLVYENLERNREEWLNLIKVSDFKKLFEYESSIPMIGVPIVNGVHWLKRLIDSVDYPVKEFFIINNNGKGEIDKDLNKIASTKHPFIEKIKVTHLPSNLGVSGAWNLIIKSYMNYPYWIIANNDICFTSGLLKKINEEALKTDSGMIHPKKADWGGGSYDLFLIKDWVVQECGLFDENLYPAYIEDVDYNIRITTKNIKSSFLNIDYLHGGSNYETSGSQTWRLNVDLKEKLDKSRILNKNEYLTKKWGENFFADTYSNPFNNENYDISYTTYDLNFNRQKYLGF